MKAEKEKVRDEKEGREGGKEEERNENKGREEGREGRRGRKKDHRKLPSIFVHSVVHV